MKQNLDQLAKPSELDPPRPIQTKKKFITEVWMSHTNNVIRKFIILQDEILFFSYNFLY